MKLPARSIKTWTDLEKLFLIRFFEDEMEVEMPTLLVTKQKKGELLRLLWRDSRVWHSIIQVVYPNIHW